MSAVLDTAKFVWDVMKDGAKLTTAGNTVTVVPQGTSMMDFGRWDGPVSFPEKYEQLSAIFESELADFTLTPNWQFNGQYIANFNVLVEGTLDVLSSLDVTVTTFEASLDGDGVVELPYHIDVRFKNVTGGTRATTYRAIGRGDGGGRSLA
jgi:hypothetical protein